MRTAGIRRVAGMFRVRMRVGMWFHFQAGNRRVTVAARFRCHALTGAPHPPYQRQLIASRGDQLHRFPRKTRGADGAHLT